MNVPKSSQLPSKLITPKYPQPICPGEYWLMGEVAVGTKLTVVMRDIGRPGTETSTGAPQNPCPIYFTSAGGDGVIGLRGFQSFITYDNYYEYQHSRQGTGNDLMLWEIMTGGYSDAEELWTVTIVPQDSDTIIGTITGSKHPGWTWTISAGGDTDQYLGLTMYLGWVPNDVVKKYAAQPEGFEMWPVVGCSNTVIVSAVIEAV